MTPDTPQPTDASGEASVGAHAEKVDQAQKIRDAAAPGDVPADAAAQLAEDAQARHRKPKASRQVRKKKAMGPVGRARAQAKGEGKPKKGKRATGAQKKTALKGKARKVQGPKRTSKPSRGSPKAARRKGNRSRG